MKTEIGISMKGAVDEALALCALRYHMSPEDKKTPLPGCDRREAIEMIIKGVWGKMCVRLKGYVAGCQCLEDEGMLRMTIEHEPTQSAMEWARALQHALALEAYGEMLAGVDPAMAQEQAARSRDLIDDVKRDISTAGRAGIEPWYY